MDGRREIWPRPRGADADAGTRRRGRNECFTVPTAGTCMRPWVWPGGVLEVRECDVAGLAVGDVAVWFDGRKLVSHRVVALSPTRFVTQGDWLGERDPEATGDALLGRAEWFTYGPVRIPLAHPLVRVAGWMSGRLLRACLRPRRAAQRGRAGVAPASPW